MKSAAKQLDYANSKYLQCDRDKDDIVIFII